MRDSDSSRSGSPNQDLVLPPGTYAYVQENTKGQVMTLLGPYVFSPTAQHQPVVFDPDAVIPFSGVGLQESIQKCMQAAEGSYLVLSNPTAGNKHPDSQEAPRIPEMQFGRKINIPGPEIFALWPGQTAEVIEGHNLRSNQYLLVRVYNEDEARSQWAEAIVKPADITPAGGVDDSKKESKKETKEDSKKTKASGFSKAPKDLSVGKLLIIKGTVVSFYIPPTGIEVLPDENGSYTRDALTLERLEYTILRHENGEKRYEVGPQVVFPEPTEVFIQDSQGNQKFRAIELNDIQGIYIKVIADYTDESGEHKAGEELFITGETCQIYYPREEHSLISYDGQKKTFATCVPAGEGRYVMDRGSGVIETVTGPTMLLPDPRTKVIVRRVLSVNESELWYPGNEESLTHNNELRDLVGSIPTTRGAVSEGEYTRSVAKKGRVRKTVGGAVRAGVPSSALLSQAFGSHVADEFSRGSTFTAPRTVTLDTKYSGVPIVNVWTGYAVMVISSASGERRVVEGPSRILLGYDESLEVLSLSQGKPKTTDRLLKTAYLRTKNNKVSDILTVESADHVNVSLKLSLRVNFEGDPEKWFEVENYVKFMTDHIRSVLKAAVKTQGIADFYSNAIPFVRDTLLGVKPKEGSRTGMFFPECGLRVEDVEVLAVDIQDKSIAKLLDDEQIAVVNSNIQLERERRHLIFVKDHEGLQRQISSAKAQTTEHKNQLTIAAADSDLTVAMNKIAHELSTQVENRKVVEAQDEVTNFTHSSNLVRALAQAEQQAGIEATKQGAKIEFLNAEAQAMAAKFEAVVPGFTAALTTLSNNETAALLAKAQSAQTLFGGENLVEVMQKMFAGTPIEAWLATRGLGNGVVAAQAE